MAKDSDNCVQDCPFSAESPAPRSQSRPCRFSSSWAREGRGAAQNPQHPLVSCLVSPPFPVGEDPYLGASPGCHRAQPHACWHRRTPSFHHASLGAARGLRRSRPPAAPARCLLLSCPMQQPRGLGYRAVSNFVPVPRHQGRGT